MSALALRRHMGDRLLGLFGLLAMLLGLVALGALLYDVARDGLGRLSWEFITSYPSRRAEQAGILPALVGSVYIIGLTTLIAVPLGVGAALHLEEYGVRGRFSRIIEINISNLAGVPSIIYGLLGLGLFVRVLGMGRSVLAGSFTLALLVLPVIIISTREALRAVPKSLREGSYALGATRWQTIWHQVLPAAFPGILTGLILALSRAIGETAPLITIGALTYVPFLPERPLLAVHRAADPDLQLGLAPAGGVRRKRRRRHRRPPAPAAGHERRRDRPTRQISEASALASAPRNC